MRPARTWVRGQWSDGAPLSLISEVDLRRMTRRLTHALRHSQKPTKPPPPTRKAARTFPPGPWRERQRPRRPCTASTRGIPTRCGGPCGSGTCFEKGEEGKRLNEGGRERERENLRETAKPKTKCFLFLFFSTRLSPFHTHANTRQKKERKNKGRVRERGKRVKVRRSPNEPEASAGKNNGALSHLTLLLFFVFCCSFSSRREKKKRKKGKPLPLTSPPLRKRSPRDTKCPSHPNSHRRFCLSLSLSLLRSHHLGGRKKERSMQKRKRPPENVLSSVLKKKNISVETFSSLFSSRGSRV